VSISSIEVLLQRSSEIGGKIICVTAMKAGCCISKRNYARCFTWRLLCPSHLMGVGKSLDNRTRAGGEIFYIIPIIVGNIADRGYDVVSHR
jgi:hypothetical protein